MKNEAISKINKIGKVGLVISRIWFVFICIGFAGLLGVTILFSFLPDNFFSMKMNGQAEIQVNIPENWDWNQNFVDDRFDNGANSFTIGDGYRVNMTDYTIDGNSVVAKGDGNLFSFDCARVRYALMFAALSVAVIGITAFFACKLCKSVKNCDSPFEENVIKNIQYLAYALIPWAIVDSSQNFVTAVLYHADNFPLEINVGKICVCLIVLAIAYIFKYGAKLQQEADETL